MEHIKQLISNGQTNEAIELLNAHLSTHPSDDEAYFLRGKAYYKQGEIQIGRAHV